MYEVPPSTTGMKYNFPAVDWIRDGPHKLNETSLSGSAFFSVAPSKGWWVCHPRMQSSHFPRSSIPETFNPLTRLFFVISVIVDGLQWVNRQCHCLREVEFDKEASTPTTPDASSLISSTTYIPFSPRAVYMTVPSLFCTTPPPSPNIIIKPA